MNNNRRYILIFLLIFFGSNLLTAQDKTTITLLEEISEDYEYDENRDEVFVQKIYELNQGLTVEDIINRINYFLIKEGEVPIIDRVYNRITFNGKKESIFSKRKTIFNISYNLYYLTTIDIKNDRIRISTYIPHYKVKFLNKVNTTTHEEELLIANSFPFKRTNYKNLEGIAFVKSIEFILEENEKILRASKTEVKKLDSLNSPIITPLDDW